MGGRWLGVALGLLLAPVALATAQEAEPAQQTQDPVGFVDAAPLVVSFASGKNEEKAVIPVRNAGPQVAATLAAVVPDGDTVPATSPLVVKVAGAQPDGTLTLAPGFNGLEVTFVRPADKRTMSGWLVLQGTGLPPAIRPISTKVADWQLEAGPVKAVIDQATLPVGPATIPITAFAIAILTVLISVIGLPLKPNVGGATWKFDESWASTLTAAGAVLGTAVGTTLLGDSPIIFSAEAYVALNLLFGFLVVLAPVVFESFRGSAGTVGTRAFIGAAAITVIAVVGEILTLTVFLLDIVPEAGSGTLRLILVVTALIGLLAMLFYAKRKIQSIAGESEDDNGKAIPKRLSKNAVEVQWSLL